MKGLLDIQREVERVERAVGDVTTALNGINRDIREIQEAASGAGMKMDYGQIRALAGNIPFSSHPLARLQDAYVCKIIYIELLLCVARLDGSGYWEKMIYIQWILEKFGLSMELEDAYFESLEREQDLYVKIQDYLNEKYRVYFLVDALIVANFVGKANADAIKYIVDLCAVLGMEPKLVASCSALAKRILCQDASLLGRDEKSDLFALVSEHKGFRNYFPNKSLWEELSAPPRQVVVELCDADYFIYWKKLSGDVVQKGESIITYRPKTKEKRPSRTIKAKSEGRLVVFRNDGVHYGVLTHPSDSASKDKIKNWVLRERGGK